jgi:hypothetical protein
MIGWARLARTARILAGAGLIIAPAHSAVGQDCDSGDAVLIMVLRGGEGEREKLQNVVGQLAHLQLLDAGLQPALLGGGGGASLAQSALALQNARRNGFEAVLSITYDVNVVDNADNFDDAGLTVTFDWFDGRGRSAARVRRDGPYDTFSDLVVLDALDTVLDQVGYGGCF